ncbi:MAG: hypothetical protein RLY40_1321 [Pseudomonadota bacterium]|jgi:hypothetical protein
MPKAGNEPREKIVNEQYEIEIGMFESKKGASVFVTPSCVTPLYIAEEDLENIKEIMHYLTEHADNKDSTDFEERVTDLIRVIPDGLIREDIIRNPALLNTVIERVESVSMLLKAGMPMVNLCVDRNRKKVNSKTEIVDDSNVKALEKKYTNLQIVSISQEQYDHYKEQVCAASYCYSDTHILKGVNATQVNAPKDKPNPWNILEGEAIKLPVAKLDELLHTMGLPSLEDMAEKKEAIAEKKAVVSTDPATFSSNRNLLFTPAANEGSAQQESKPSSTTYRHT